LHAYTNRIVIGAVDPNAEITVTQKKPISALINGNNALGSYVSYEATELTAKFAKDFGMGSVAVYGSNHYGAASYYTEMLAKQGLIDFCCANSTASVVPWGAMKPYMGTNPLSYAVPAGKYEPMLLDMATSVVARNRIRNSARRNEPIPGDWALDAEGRPTTDANAAMNGLILPFGGPKGSGIALLVEVLSRVVSYAGASTQLTSVFDDGDIRPSNTGHFFMAIDPEIFIPIEEYKKHIESMVEEIKALPAVPGSDQVYLPGEIERNIAARRAVEGIPIDDVVLKEFQALAQKYSIPFVS